jgi:dynein heavy chain
LNFLKAAKVHEKCSTIGWELDKTTIFAQIDAFIQRCKDLIDVNLEKK